MFNDDSRNTLRQQFFDVFKKSKISAPLSALETLLLNVIQAHPEYMTYLETPERYLEKDFHPTVGETNPFLHMGAHIGIQEQVQTNRPKGISTLYMRIVKKFDGNEHAAEHALMEVMMETLWIAQRNNQLPDEQFYIKKCRKLLK
jgi:hypothetical protein